MAGKERTDEVETVGRTDDQRLPVLRSGRTATLRLRTRGIEKCMLLNHNIAQDD